jgi:hypothetical protein
MADPLSQVPHPDCDSESPGDGSDADPEGVSPEALIASSSAPQKAPVASSSAPGSVSLASGGSSSAPDASSSAPGSVLPSWVRPGAPCQALYAYKSDDGHQHFYHAVVKEVQDDRVCVEWVNAIDYNLKGQKIGKWDKTEWVDTVRHPNSITFGDSSTRGESNSIEARTLAASALSLNLLVTEEEKRKRAAEERAAKSSAKQYYEGCRKRAAAKSPARMGA